MHNNRKCSNRRGVAPLENQGWVNGQHNVSPASAFGGSLPSASKMPRPVHDIEFQPSEVCPQNFIIVDEDANQSRIMYHPGIAHNLSYPNMDFHETPNGEITQENFGNNFEGGIVSPDMEDSDYIDLLMSLDENQGESEEEEVSTAGTQGYDGSSSPESFCNYTTKCRKATYPCSVQRASTSGSSHNENKRKEARKMVKVLRGMVPGGDQMNTAAVFDAAVHHLKGLEGKVQRLGLSNHKHFP
ncbi:hypothetical protein SOVF_027880 [Spinacia oleracea]|uniref:Transcription factor bHLH144 n=1 Tax=Spinacia oleracea TaxID=3562 RepID=A0A9R0IIW7_SPIOL|nr:transcription factor bHLH144-like [Spinacia oleracea]XP_056684195.1 transcription factor bHLH144-like [Spinacia oleracea]KNA23000.1 hypothetical protein SOVF_027880 [Spinacia oleracea]